MDGSQISFKTILKLLAASLILGIIGGSIGAVFSLLIGFVTQIRTEHNWFIFLLPICGIIIVFLYKKMGIFGQSTDTVFRAENDEEKLSPILSLGVFITSVLSHLCGASVGREGAALQIGGSFSVVLSKLFHIDNNGQKILLRAGMAAVFSAVFGTPVTAILFVLEIFCVGTFHLQSVLPSIIASFSAFAASLLLGAHPERFTLTQIPALSFETVWKISILTVLTAVLSIGFCHSLQHIGRFAKKILKNPYLRISAGGLLIIILTVLVGNNDYNGAGINAIERIFESGFENPNSISFKPEAFFLKLLFTCVSVAAGFKGGEIVPTLFIGATFGALLSSLLSFNIPFGAALCMVLLFSGVTNCPLASIALAYELFSGVGFWYFIPTVAVCFMLSGKISLYPAQKHKFKYM